MNLSDPNPAPVIALVRSNNRRGATAEALALLQDEWANAFQNLGPDVLVVPSLSRSAHRSTPPAVVSAVVDAILAIGGRPILHLDSSSPRSHPYTLEVWGRPVEFDPAAESRSTLSVLLETPWNPRRIPRSDPTLTIVEGPIGWFRREVLAVAGFDRLRVESVASLEVGRTASLTGPIHWLGDPPRFRPLPPSLVPFAPSHHLRQTLARWQDAASPPPLGHRLANHQGERV